MHFNLALIPSILLASTALAVRRGHYRRSTPLESSPQETYSGNVSAVIIDGAITSVTGTFAAPPVTGPAGSSSFVGLTASPACDTTVLAILVAAAEGGDEAPYAAVYAWTNSNGVGPVGTFNETIDAGDSLTFTFEATSKTSGSFTLVNNSKSKAKSTVPIKGAPELCEEGAGFIAGTWENDPLANLGKVVITDAKASGPKGSYQAGDYAGLQGAQVGKARIESEASGSTATFIYTS